jgi:hypothetical protein
MGGNVRLGKPVHRSLTINLMKKSAKSKTSESGKSLLPLDKRARASSLVIKCGGAIVIFAFCISVAVICMRPVPRNLMTASGKIGNISAYKDCGRGCVRLLNPGQRYESLNSVDLRVTGIDKTFTYGIPLPNKERLYETARMNMPIKVMYSGTEKPVLWGLELNGEKFIDPDEARAYRAQEGYYFLALAAGVLLYVSYFVYKDRQFNRKLWSQNRK